MTFNECVSQYLTHSSCLFKCQISHGFFFSSCWKSHANNNQFWLMPSSRSAGNVRSGRFKRLEQKTMPVTPPPENQAPQLLPWGPPVIHSLFSWPFTHLQAINSKKTHRVAIPRERQSVCVFMSIRHLYLLKLLRTSEFSRENLS